MCIIKGMKTLIKSEPKLKVASFDYSTYEIKEKSDNPKFSINFKFYQKLFLILISSCIFLIIPESPKDSEILCKKYYSSEACNIW